MVQNSCSYCETISQYDSGCNECKCVTNATTGATDARLGVRELCLGARRAGDSNTKWWRRGALLGAHNLLGNGAEQRETSQTSVLLE
jgi:hypothetical protein